MHTRRKFLKDAAASAFLLTQAGLLTSCKRGDKDNAGTGDNPVPAPGSSPVFGTRGLIIDWGAPGTMLDWPRIAHDTGLTMLGITVSERVTSSSDWMKFYEACTKYDVRIEHPQHAMSMLLPRELFKDDPSMFRMNEQGERTPDFNCCTASEKGLEIIAGNAAKNARTFPSTSGRYYFWMDDGGKKCNCPVDKDLSASDQAMIVENAIIKQLRLTDKRNSVAHLAYHDTIPAPGRIQPAEGLFLQFAPFERTWDYPIADPTAKRAGMNITNADYLRHLDDNLKLFPKETAEILEYWVDDSLFSNWTKPAKKLPWNKEVFLADIDTYAKRGIRDIVSFAVYIDQDYVNMYKDIGFLTDYGNGLKNYRL